jgi:FtsP/CotA-like multicopper oxidase with cupredoxin domain
LVRIRLKNAGKEPHSVHTHVIKYTPANDGTDATATPPGETRYYFWEVTADTPTGFYPFHDHGGGGEGAMERGLVGMVNVVAPGGASDAGYGILLHDLDPRYLYSTSGAPIPGSGGGGGHGNHGGGGMASADVPAHLINGRFGPAAANRFKVSKGKTLRLGVVNLGTDIHTFHPHGNSFKTPEGELGDNLEVLPGGYRTVTMQGEAAGDWQYHCHVPGHPEGGMVARYVVE